MQIKINVLIQNVIKGFLIVYIFVNCIYFFIIKNEILGHYAINISDALKVSKLNFSVNVRYPLKPLRNTEYLFERNFFR